MNRGIPDCFLGLSAAPTQAFKRKRGCIKCSPEYWQIVFQQAQKNENPDFLNVISDAPRMGP